MDEKEIPVECSSMYSSSYDHRNILEKTLRAHGGGKRQNKKKLTLEANIFYCQIGCTVDEMGLDLSVWSDDRKMVKFIT